MGPKPSSSKNSNKQPVPTVNRPNIMPYVPGSQAVGDDFQGYDNTPQDQKFNMTDNDLNNLQGAKNNFDPDALYYLTNMSI